MSRTEARMGQIIRWDARKDASFVQALSFEMDKDTLARIGHCYGIIAVDTKGRKGQALAAHVEDSFARGAIEAVRKLPIDAPQDQLFEAAVSRVNHALARLFGEYGLEIEPETVTAAIISFVSHDVVATTWGKPTALLYHPLANGQAKVFDLADDGGVEQPSSLKPANNRRCFGSIISGRMGKNDRVLLASHDLRALLGEEQVEYTVIDNEPGQATQILEQMMAPSRAGSVAALVLDVAEIRYLETDPNLETVRTPVRKMRPATPPRPPSDSISERLRVQSEVAETMTPTLIGGLGKKVGALFNRDQRDQREVEPESEPPLSPEPTLAPEPPIPPAVSYDVNEYDARDSEESRRAPAVMLVEISAFAWKIIKKVSSGAMSLARGAWKFALGLRTAESRAAAITGARQALPKLGRNLVKGFAAMPLSRKAMLLAVVALAITVQVGLKMQSRSQAKEDMVAMQERAIDTINQKIDAAEASIIYRDENRARVLLAEAASAVNALPQETPERAAQRQVLQKKISESENALRREISLAEPVILASISTADGVPTIAKIEPADGGVLWLASTTGEIFKVTTNDGSSEKVANAPGGKQPAIFLAQGKDVLAVSSEGQGLLVTQAGKTSDKAVVLGDSGSTLADSGLYGGRLYALDPAHNRIVRHAATTDGYGDSDPYMKDGTDLSHGVSLAIDGFVWVLRADGSVVRIVKGLQEAFAVGTPEPAMTAALRLRTDADRDLFILDSSPARILRFNKKTGALMGQYVSPALKGATDFAIDYDANMALVTVKNQALKFALPVAK